jgi:hypothetical protein
MPDTYQSKPAAVLSVGAQAEAKQERRLHVEVELPDYFPARMLNEFVYCPRLFFYEWVEGIFATSADTIEGELRHEKLETKSDPLPPPDSGAQVHSRSVSLSSETHRLIAKMDLVEGEAGTVRWAQSFRPRSGILKVKSYPC